MVLSSRLGFVPALPQVRGAVAVVGSRSAPAAAGPWVAGVVGAVVSAGLPVWSGGAVGADQLALTALVAGGRAACAGSVIWSAFGVWPAAAPRFPVPVRAQLARFVLQGGRVSFPPQLAGLPPRAALARRAVLMCQSAALVVSLVAVPAPPAGAVGGSWGSVLAAARAGVPVAVLPCGFPPAALPASLAGVAGRWLPLAPAAPLAAALAAPSPVAVGALLWVPSAPAASQPRLC